MNWRTVYNAFPVNQELIWLNNCGTTPAGVHVVDAVSRFMGGYAGKGILAESNPYSRVGRQIKSILANLLNCQPEELALIHNTAEGMNFISHGLSLSPGDEIVLLENEYPSNIYPWYHLRRKGVKFVTVPMGDSPENFMDKLTGCLGTRTRVVSVSAVHWCTGMPLPIDQIGERCRENNITFVLDGAQGVGMRPIDVKAAGIDYMAFSAWKWLMGPLGLGVFFVSGERLDDLDSVIIGTQSVVQAEEYLPYKSELKPDADRFTYSTPSLGDWIYFLAALEFLQAIGFDVVRERLYELSLHLMEGLGRIGFKVLADRFASHPTGIIVCEKPGTNTRSIMEHLKQNGIVAAERLGRVRFSPHIYISPDQIDEVIRVLSRV